MAFSLLAETDAWSQELRFSGDLDELSWIVGSYYSHDEVDSTSGKVALDWNVTANAIDIRANRSIAAPFSAYKYKIDCAHNPLIYNTLIAKNFFSLQ